jgi:hypothetical protein
MRRPGPTNARAAPNPGGPCEPSVLGPQLTLWLRADLGITIGTGVSAWADQSGYGNTFTQATGGLQPTYTAVNGNFRGQPSVNPVAAGSLLACAGSVVIRHLLIVANYPGAVFVADDPALFSAGGGGIVFRGGSGPVWGGPDYTGNIYRDGARTTIALDVANRPHVHEFVMSTAASATWRIGDDAGGGTTWSGSVAEVIASRDIIPDRTLLSIRQMLRNRYGTP